MKILQINQVYGIGSTGHIMQDLQSMCFQNNIECYVAYAQKNPSIDDTRYMYAIGCTFEHKLHGLFSRIGGKEGYFSYFSTYRLLRYIDKIKPDIIHIHNLHSHYINFPILLTYIAKHDIRTIVTMHDCWIITGQCYHFTNTGCYKWKNECGNCPRRYIDNPAYLYDSSKQQLRDRKKYYGSIPRLTIVSVSKWLEGIVRDSVLKEKQIICIHNGVDTNVFKPASSDLRTRLGIEEKFVILAPASKWMSKENSRNLKYLLEHLNDDMCLIFYGYGCDDNISSSNVINYGYTNSQTELAQLYTIADVFVNCTREDCLPFTNLEPQACGTPVITFANTGTLETVDEKCSFSVANDDMDAMWYMILEIVRLGKNTFSQKCIDWVRKNFPKYANYNKYLELYKQY